MKQEKIDKILFEIYRRMYKEATPSADFDKLHEEGITKQDRFFMDYYLDIDRQEEIIDDVLDKFKVKGYIRKSFQITVALGCSPTSVKPEKHEQKL